MVHQHPTPQRSRAEALGREVSTFKVTKKITPGSPGAQKLQDLYGNALVCVRHHITARARAVGATWDPSAHLCKMPLKSTEMLGLTERVHKLDQ